MEGENETERGQKRKYEEIGPHEEEPEPKRLKSVTDVDFTKDLPFKKVLSEIDGVTQEIQEVNRDIKMVELRRKRIQMRRSTYGMKKKQLRDEKNKLTFQDLPNIDPNADRLWKVLQNEEVSMTQLNGVTVAQLPDGVNWLTETSSTLFIRRCSEDMFDIIHKELGQAPEHGMLLTGNPGIGKSWSLSYYLMRLAKEERDVVFESVAQDQSWLFRKDGSTCVFSMSQPFSRPPELRDLNTVYLFDCAAKAPREPIQCNAYTIVASSPNIGNYKQFFKRVAMVYYLPCWSLQDLQSILKFFPHLDKKLVQERFHRYGGIPRSVLSSPKRLENEALDQHLTSAINSFDLSALIRMKDDLESLGEYSHKLFHYEVGPNYHKIGLHFASDYVRHQISALIIKYRSQGLQYFLEDARNSTINIVAGTVFEEFAHSALKRGGDFTIRPLSNCDESETTTRLKIPPLKEVTWNGWSLVGLQDIIGLQKDKFVKTDSSNIPALDSLDWIESQWSAFQCTVAINHPINVDTLSNNVFSPPLNITIRVYFVVPETLFHKFSLQTLLWKSLFPPKYKLEQWVLAIPLVE